MKAEASERFSMKGELRKRVEKGKIFHSGVAYRRRHMAGSTDDEGIRGRRRKRRSIGKDILCCYCY